jgi:hypothetical protein
MNGSWTSAADIRARVKRRWDDGTLLRALACDEPCPLIEIALCGPRASEIGDDIDAVRRWIDDLRAGSRGGTRYVLDNVSVGGRHFGRNEMPSRARVDTYGQAFALIGVVDEAAQYRRALDAAAPEPEMRAWVAANPRRALTVADAWPSLVSAYRWLRDSKGSRRYLREITAPGVDTKFVERHRAILAETLGVPSSASAFLTGLGLRAKPEVLRLRPHPELNLASGLTDLAVRREELALLNLTVDRALIIENEITFLSVPVPAGGLVLWGRGFDVGLAGSMPWLADADIDYWGDLDTHGFAILNQLRAWLPQTRSLLMDRDTLTSHRDRWVIEPTPTSAALTRLTIEEASLYDDLVCDRLGVQVRLEQERIDWSWASATLRAEARPKT